MSANAKECALPATARTISRQQWIDSAKGLGILCVVLVHTVNGLKAPGIMPTDSAWEFWDDWLYVFQVPIFFFVSGLLADRSYEKYGFRVFLKTKIAALAYPYIVWQTLQILIMLASGGAANRKPTPGLLLSFPLHPYMQFWFLYALILVIVLYSVLKLAKIPSTVIAVISLIMLFLPRVGWSPYNDLCQHMVYFACGLLWHGKMESLQKVRPGFLLLAALACGFGVAKLVHWGVNIDSPLRPIGAILGIAGVSLLSFAMVKRPWWGVVSALGRASLEIYVAHVVFAAGMRVLLVKVFHVENLAVHVCLGLIAGVAGPLFILALQRAPARFRIPLFRANLSAG